MLEPDKNAVTAEPGSSGDSQSEKQPNGEFVVEENHEPNLCLPENVNQLLAQISDQAVVDELKRLMLENVRDLSQHKQDCAKARTEAAEIRDKLHRTETELGDLQSAAALMIAGQDDALVALKRQYDEELASWRSISEQEILELTAANQTLLEKERANWAGERNALLSKISSTPRKFSLEEKATADAVSLGTGAATAASGGGGGGATNTAVKFFSVTDRLSGQHLANQALESVERMARRVRQKVLSNSLLGEDEPDSSDDNADVQTLRNRLRVYEHEVLRLRKLLNEPSTPIATGLPNAPTPTKTVVADCQSATDTQDASNTVEKPLDESDPVDPPEDDPNTPITETSWVQLQSKLKEIPRQTSTPCAMCINYEQQLQNLQLNQQEKDKNLRALGKELSARTTELTELNEIKKQLESDLKTRSAEQNERMDKLDSQFTLIQKRVESLLNNYRSHRQATEAQLAQLSRERQSVQTDLNTLQMHYDALLGRRSVAAKELSERPIQLPSSKADLELLALRMYEENLALREAREHLDDRLKSDNQFHQQQLIAERQERINFETTLQRELDEAHARLAFLVDLEKQRDTEAAARTKAEEEAKSARTKLAELQTKLSQAEEDASSARAEVETLQKRIITLQADLNNVESVQADFVRLSQNLQVQLERLRQEDHEVRWVDPDDVKLCFACGSSFAGGLSSAERKTNCRHCGKVHCAKCVQNTMPSGPVGRRAPVCNVCYTLLNKHVAPYFSTSFQDPSTGTQIRVSSPNAKQHDSPGGGKVKGKSHSNSPRTKNASDASGRD